MLHLLQQVAIKESYFLSFLVIPHVHLAILYFFGYNMFFTSKTVSKI